MKKSPGSYLRSEGLSKHVVPRNDQLHRSLGYLDY